MRGPDSLRTAGALGGGIGGRRSGLGPRRIPVAEPPLRDLRSAERRLQFCAGHYQGKSSARGAVTARAIGSRTQRRESAQALVDELRNRRQSLQSEKTVLVLRRDALRVQRELLVDETRAAGPGWYCAWTPHKHDSNKPRSRWHRPGCAWIA